MKKIIFFVLLLLVGCSFDFFKPEPVPITVKLIDEKNAPITDAFVSIKFTKSRDENGDFISLLDAPRSVNKHGIYTRTVPIGSYRISARSKSKGYIINSVIHVKENKKHFTLKRNIFQGMP